VIEISEDEDEGSEIEEIIEKIQPPAVRINPNLMKIKIEEDYNPIIVLKREPVEDNVVDMREDYDEIDEPEEEAVDHNETGMGEEVQRQSYLSQVKIQKQ